MISEFSLKVPSQNWLGKFCIFHNKVALTFSGKYQNKEKPLKCQRKLGLLFPLKYIIPLFPITPRRASLVISTVISMVISVYRVTWATEPKNTRTKESGCQSHIDVQNYMHGLVAISVPPYFKQPSRSTQHATLLHYIRFILRPIIRGQATGWLGWNNRPWGL